MRILRVWPRLKNQPEELRKRGTHSIKTLIIINGRTMSKFSTKKK